MNKPSFTALATLAVALSLTAVLCSFQLRPSEKALVTTLGRSSVVSVSGLHWRLPWPLQKIEKIDVRRQLLPGALRDVPTADDILLVSSVCLSYHVSDVATFHASIGRNADVAAILRPAVDTVQQRLLRSLSLPQLFQPGALEKLEAELTAELNRQTQAQYGITVDLASLEQLGVHAKNTEAIFERMRQELQRQAALIRSQAQAEATRTLAKAEAERSTLLAQADAEAKKADALALAAMTDGLKEHARYTDFLVWMRKLDALSALTKHETTLILDPRTPPLDLLLPESAPAPVPARQAPQSATP